VKGRIVRKDVEQLAVPMSREKQIQIRIRWST
jgi:hypothetical protein